MISVVLVTYNRAKRLRLSIQDIIDQTFSEFELIICDDNSYDGTQDICKEFCILDKRIKYYRHESNIGMPGNLNFGIKKATFEYIAILHDGDRFKNTLLQNWYDAISKNETVGLVFNSIGVTDLNDHLQTSFSEFETGVLERRYLLQNIFFRRWYFDSPVYGEVMVRKSLILKNGFFKYKYGFYSDVDMWMTILHDYNAFYYKQTLITGPAKIFQPRLFNDNSLVVFFYMYDMHYQHRIIEFRNKVILFSELTRFYFYSLLGFFYCLVLIVKNGTYQMFFDGASLIFRKRLFFILPWLIVLIFSPFIKLLKFLKNK